MSDSTQQGAEQHIITKPVKNPGRVAQGHKLAALMKKRKEELRHSSGDSSISGISSSTSSSTSASTSSSTAMLGATAVTVIVIVGVGIWYKFFKQQQQPEKSSEQPPPVEVADRLEAPQGHCASKKVQNKKIDIFKMR